MAKKTQLDRALENLDAEIEVLQAARTRLLHERNAVASKPKRTRKPERVTIADTLGVALVNR